MRSRFLWKKSTLIKTFYLLTLFFLWSPLVYTQVPFSDCATAVNLDQTSNSCLELLPASTLGMQLQDIGIHGNNHDGTGTCLTDYTSTTYGINTDVFNDLWFKFIGDGQSYIVSGACTNSTNGSEIFNFVYSGNCGNLSLVQCYDYYTNPGVPNSIYFPTVAGETYYVVMEVVGSFICCASSCQTNFGITVCPNSSFPVPPNDLCSGAAPISAGLNVADNTTGTTFNDAPAAINGVALNQGGGCWYTFPGTGQNATISTANPGTTIDTQVGILEGSSCGSLNPVTADNNSGSSPSGSSFISFPTTAGVPCYVYVTSLTEGPFELSLSFGGSGNVPANDLCSGAVSISAGSNITDNTTGTTTNDAPAAINSIALNQGGGCWYTFPGTGQNATISTANPGTSIDTQVGILEGNSCGSLNPITADNNSGSSPIGSSSISFPTTAGVPCYVYVASPTAGSFELSLSFAGSGNAPSNDLCVNAIPLTVDGPSITGNTINATNIDTPCNPGDCDTGIWYSFIGTGNPVDVSTCFPTTDFPARVLLWPGSCGLFVNTAQSCLFEICNSNSSNSFTATYTTVLNDTYFIYVTETQGNSPLTGNFELQLTTSTACGGSAPANDDCANATVVNTGTTAGTTTNSTPDTAPFCSGGSSSTAPGVWYSFTPATTGSFNVNLCGAPYDSHIAIYTGSCGALSCVIAEDDDFTDCGDNDPFVDWTGNAGTTYSIFVSGFSPETGDFDLTISSISPSNDQCANATDLTYDAQPISGSITNALEDNVVVCGQLPDDIGVWYTFIGNGGNTAISTDFASNTLFSTEIGVYSGSCAALICEEYMGSNGSVANGSTLTVPTINGTTYYVWVEGASNETSGDFSISIETAAPDNDLCGDASAINYDVPEFGTTVGASALDNPTCAPVDSNPGVWYSFTGNGGMENLTISGMNAEFAVLEGSCGALTCLGGASTDIGNGSFDFPTTVGNTYYVFAEGVSVSNIFFTLALTNLCDFPVPVCQNTTVALNAAGNGSITTADINNNSTADCGGMVLALSGQTSFNCTDIGTSPVTLTVSDQFNNSASCNATVTIVDNTDPNAVCTNYTAILDASGAVSISAANVDGGSFDNCNIASSSLGTSQTSFSCTDIGTPVSVTLTVTDGSSNSDDCTATITVVDQTPPTVTCNNVTAQLDANGVATIDVPTILNTANDNCTVLPGGQLTQSGFVCGDLGANTVTLTVTDVNGLSGSCQATVTVEDNVAPIAMCKDITVQLDVNGNANIVGADLDNGSTDACGPLTFAASTTAFNCGDVGVPNNVVLTVSDGSGNSATCNSNITVEDNIAPVANCQNVTVLLDDNGEGSTSAGAIDNGSSDACSVSLSLSQTDFTCSNIGPNTVVLTVTDPSGNESTCTAIVTVVDPIPAVILCRPNINTVNEPGVCGADVIMLPPLVIVENCSIANVTNNAPNVFPIGTTPVTWTLTDAGGNDSQCMQNVTVHDTELPTIDCGEPFIAYTSWDNCGYPSGLLDPVFASDNCPGWFVTNDAPGFFPPGQYMVNYTVTDAAGNSSTCMKWVKVYDATKPKLVTCPEDIEIEATDTEGTTVSWSLPTGMDNCPGELILIEANGYAPGDYFELGETEISYRLYDVNGQFVECNFTISVVPIGSLGLDLACMPNLDISLQNAMGWSALGWSPPLMDSNCETCEVLASDDFQFIGTLSGHQYYTHTAEIMSFNDALDYAENWGVSIAVLEDKKEVPMIENEMPEGNYFIGLIDAEGTGEFEWIDETEYVQSDFGVDFENDSEEPAIVVLNEEGEWEVQLIADAKANFVFEKVCIELAVEINEGDEDETPDLADAGTTAEVVYTAVDECGNVSSCGFEVVLAAEAVAYCEPTGIATDEENPYFIESFSLNGYTVETGDDQGYGDHTDQHFLFQPGEILEMHTIFDGPAIDELPMYCRIWMDLNNDGDFYDEGELIMQGVDVAEVIAELEIPNLNQTVENTVMRIAISRLTYAESCGDFLNGEVEDYSISIVKPEESQQSSIGAIVTSTFGADLVVYPNPAQKELFVKLNDLEATTATLRMYNGVGQLVTTQRVTTNSTVRMDISEYTNGLYSVITETDSGERLIQKFIVKK